MRSAFDSMIMMFVLLSSVGMVQASESPYAGQEKRAIKALSQQEIDDYINGRGMGTSKVAELNRYPGPRHVLDEAEKLGLSDGQLIRTQKIFDHMSDRAARVGRAIVAKEAELEDLYAQQKAAPENTTQLVMELARLQADFRLAHLNAHLAMQEVLSAHQVEMYHQLRGYAGPKSHGHGHQHR